MSETLGRFGHHPDPATDFEIEVDALMGMWINRKTGFDPEHDFAPRMEKAMQFRVGGVRSAISAKGALRGIYEDFAAGTKTGT
jgi:hypothetical protein